jgi:membrane-bound lytic murein transglycosylase D
LNRGDPGLVFALFRTQMILTLLMPAAGCQPSGRAILGKEISDPMKNRRYKSFLLSIIPVALVFASIHAGADTLLEPDSFPIYDSIRPNISFWKKIYSEYSTTQGVIHDKQNLGIIYDVIELKDRDHHGNGKINRDRIKAAKKKYKLILVELAQGETPVGAEERRVADLFGANAKPEDFRAAMRNLRCQVGQKDPFRQGIIRSGAYLQEIKQIFRDSGLPEDLAYLPHVESSFNPQAYSKFGAAGIWQFTRSTGKRYMTVSYAVDERRDPLISSHAASRLLKANFKKFQNWPMAITAYNHGVSGMLRAQRHKGDCEAIFKDYRSHIFKFASRNFYSEFLAACEVARNYRLHFGELALDKPLKSQAVVLAGYGSLPEIARQLELELHVLRNLNPALRDPVIRGQKYVPRGFSLRLPAQSDRNWQSVIAELAPKIYKNDQKRSRIYTVQKGDTAGEIARIHGVNLNDLIAANNLDARATIYIDQNLRIPIPGEQPPVLASLKSNRAEPKFVDNSKKPEQSTETPEPAIETPEPEEAPMLSSLDFDTIESNRTVAAARIQRTPKSAKLEKRMTADQREPEPVSIEPSLNPAVVQGNLAVKHIQNQHGRLIGIIRVEVEETLGHYAEWLEVSAGDLRRLNGLRYGEPIQINEAIKIPMSRVTKAEFEEKRFEYHKELAEDFFASYRVEKVQIYTIKRGDNIWTLSRERFEVPLWLIKKFNAHLDISTLHPSQELLIPIIEKNQV